MAFFGWLILNLQGYMPLAVSQRPLALATKRAEYFALLKSRECIIDPAEVANLSPERKTLYKEVNAYCGILNICKISVDLPRTFSPGYQAFCSAKELQDVKQHIAITLPFQRL